MGAASRLGRRVSLLRGSSSEVSADSQLDHLQRLRIGWHLPGTFRCRDSGPPRGAADARCYQREWMTGETATPVTRHASSHFRKAEKSLQLLIACSKWSATPASLS